jgi:hypothetical protein
MKISSSLMLLICVLVLLSGFIWATFFPNSPYGVLAPSVVALAAGYWTKRTVQKNAKFGGSCYKPDEKPSGPIGD